MKLLEAIESAAALLPPKYDNGIPYKRLMLGITFQEADGIHRKQKGGGPARGLWQYEKGTVESRGGVTGLMLHPATRIDLLHFTESFGIPFDADAIWKALEFNDVLAAGLARLSLWIGPGKIPTTEKAAWEYYESIWNPGQPRPEKWPKSWALANEELKKAGLVK
jgi:hypothetical protein